MRVTERLGYRKLCARWLPEMLSEGHKENRVATARSFVACCVEQGDDFLDCTVTRDETWVFHHTPETKRQSVQWCHTHSPETEKFRTSNVNEENHGSCLFGQEGASSCRFPASSRHHTCCYILRVPEKITLSNSKQAARNADTRSLPTARQCETAHRSRHIGVAGF